MPGTHANSILKLQLWPIHIYEGDSIGKDTSTIMCSQQVATMPDTSIPFFKPTQSYFQWLLGGGGTSPTVKWPRHEAANLTPSSTTIKHEWSYTSKPLYAFMECVAMTFPLSMLHLCHYWSCTALPVVIQMFLQTHVYNLCSYQTTPKYNAQLVEALHFKPEVHIWFSTDLILPAALQLWDLLSLCQKWVPEVLPVG